MIWKRLFGRVVNSSRSVLPASENTATAAAATAADNGINKSSNNQMQRYLRFQQTMYKKRWFELDREKNGPITIFDFKTSIDADDVPNTIGTSSISSRHDNVWRTTDDSIIGGYSTGRMQIIKTQDEYNRITTINTGNRNSIDEEEKISKLNHDEHEDVEKSSNKKKDMSMNMNMNTTDDTVVLPATAATTTSTILAPSSASFLPFLRWDGTIDTTVPDNDGHNNSSIDNNKAINNNGQSQQVVRHAVQRSGFCSILSPEFGSSFSDSTLDLDGRYNGLEIMCRSDGRPYSFNLKIESFIPDDLYQCFIDIPPTVSSNANDRHEEDNNILQYDRVVLLFKHFAVTGGGKLRARQRILDDGNVKIQSMGITLMDNTNGDFEFDLGRIRAINYDESGIIGTPD